MWCLIFRELCLLMGLVELCDLASITVSGAKSKRSLEPKPKIPTKCFEIEVNYNRSTSVLFDVCRVVDCGEENRWRGHHIYGCASYPSPEPYCPTWGSVFTHSNPNYKFHYDPTARSSRGRVLGLDDKPRAYLGTKLQLRGKTVLLTLPKLSSYGWGPQLNYYFTLGVDVQGEDPLGIVCVKPKVTVVTSNITSKIEELGESSQKPQPVVIATTEAMDWRDQLAVKTGHEEPNMWLEWVRFTVKSIDVKDCFVCAAAKPNLATHPVTSGNWTCLISLFNEIEPVGCENLSMSHPLTQEPTPTGIKAYKGNYTCFRSNKPGPINRGHFSEGWCKETIILDSDGNYTDSQLNAQKYSRADLVWLCGDMRIRRRLHGNWSGECALVFLIMPFRIYKQHGVDDAADILTNHHSHRRDTREVKPGGSFDKTVWIDGIGVPRGVPDEFKARNQIAAGFESALFWWVTINKNVDWINYLYYNQQRFVNFSVQAIEGLRDQLDQTSLMTIQNRMALDMLLAEKGGVCQIVGSSCCTFIPNNTAPDGSVTRALEGLRALSQEWKENSGIDKEWVKWLEGIFGPWKGIIASLVLSACGGSTILLVCGCCVPCIRMLIGRSVAGIVSRGNQGGRDPPVIQMVLADLSKYYIDDEVEDTLEGGPENPP